MAKGRSVLLLAALIVPFGAAAACRHGPSEIGQNTSLVSHQHPNGLVLDLPGGFSVTRTNDGFRIRPAGSEDRRSYDDTHIRLVSRGDLPDGEWPERRRVNDVEYRYRIESVNGGSGGAEWRLVAYADVGDRLIVCTHHTQVELGRPNFDPAWRILGGVRVAAATPAPRP